jgi:hypothetical protein
MRMSVFREGGGSRWTLYSCDLVLEGTWGHFCFTLLVGTVMSLSQTQGERNTPIAGGGKALEEHGGPEILVWPFFEKTVCHAVFL